MQSELVGIARIVEIKPDVFQADILLNGTKTPVAFIYRDLHSSVATRLKEMYPNVVIVRNQQFLCELDHIKLFDCRSDNQDWTPSF